MITSKEARTALTSGEMTLELSQWGDGDRGVGLYRKGSTMPIERIAIMHWHVDQEDGLQYADKELETWFYEIFGAGELSNQAREMLQAFCKDHAEVIVAWCDGDETAVLPRFGEVMA
jgi:hypothetical protein